MRVVIGNAVVHVCSFTQFNDVRLRVGRRVYRFSFSKQFGPRMLDRRGRDVSTLPGVRKEAAFWDALQWWCQQGHRVVDGFGVYDAPPVEIWWAPDGKNFVLDTPANRKKYAAQVTTRQRQIRVRADKVLP